MAIISVPIGAQEKDPEIPGPSGKAYSFNVALVC